MKYERITDKEHRYKKCAGCTYKKCQYCDDKPDYEREGYNRLAELEDKIEQGYIKILPVKAGDKIYVLPSKASYGINRMDKIYREHNRVYTQTVDEIRFFKDGVYMVYSCEYQQNHHSALLGETWFLEYEQAKTRLKEMEEMYAKGNFAEHAPEMG